MDRVKAIDLNPLAILTARINYFIRISSLLPDDLPPIQIPVYLGDACYSPIIREVGGIDCICYSIKTLENPISIVLPKNLTSDINKFHSMMYNYEKCIEQQDKNAAINLFIENWNELSNNQVVLNHITKFTDELIQLEAKNWNGIWARIIANFLITVNLEKFDIIIGNPPWIDWKNLPSGYREKIKSLCIDRNLFSGDGRTGGINLNVCALIATVSIDNWLKDNGKLAFLMPKVIAFQQSYEGYRQFRTHVIKRNFLEFIDWSDAGHPFHPVTEKFMTYIIGPESERGEYIPVIRYKKKRGKKIAGEQHLSLEEALERLNHEELSAGQIIPNTSIYTFSDNESDLKLFRLIAGISDYIGREGIEFYPQELLLFRILDSPSIRVNNELIIVQNIKVAGSKYPIPQQKIILEKKYLFPLVKGPEISAFQHNYSGIVVPFPYDCANPRQPLNQQQLRGTKLLEFYRQFQSIFESQTNYSDSLRGNNPGDFYGLARVGPYSFMNHYVAFRDNTKWCASVISPIQTDWGGNKRFVFQNHAVSICEDSERNYITEDEAHYICAIMNSKIVERYILSSSDPRSYKIRPPIKIPKYNAKNPYQKQLSELSKTAHQNASIIDEVRDEIDTVYVNFLRGHDTQV